MVVGEVVCGKIDSWRLLQVIDFRIVRANSRALKEQNGALRFKRALYKLSNCIIEGRLRVGLVPHGDLIRGGSVARWFRSAFLLVSFWR